MRPEASAHSGTTERESCSSAESLTSGHGYPATKIPEEPKNNTFDHIPELHRNMKKEMAESRTLRVVWIK